MTTGVFYNSETGTYQHTWNLTDDPRAVRERDKVYNTCGQATCMQKTLIVAGSIFAFSTAALMVCGINDCFSGNEDKTCNCNDFVQITAIVGEVLGGLGICFGMIGCMVMEK